MAGLLADRELADAVEADLRRFYGVDLRELYAGRLRVRQLCVYIRALPTDAFLVLLIDRREQRTTGSQFASASELAAFIGATRKG